MKSATRRDFIAAAALPSIATSQISQATEQRAIGTTAMLHVTDLYRPHEDPDDHWDLSCVYALAYSRAVDLRGVVIDHSLELHDRTHDPDVISVAQLNYLTSLNVPVGIGRMSCLFACQASAPAEVAPSCVPSLRY